MKCSLHAVGQSDRFVIGQEKHEEQTRFWGVVGVRHLIDDATSGTAPQLAYFLENAAASRRIAHRGDNRVCSSRSLHLNLDW